MRGKGRLVHGALETLTHTTQQVTTHSSEPHPQASGVVPSSHTMRWLLAVSCLSLSRAVPIPTIPVTPAPETRAPPTAVPRAPCEALLSPPLVATIKAPVRAEYVECWTFQCVGTVEVTFRNITTSSNPYARMTLQNSDGYVLTSLVEHRERYIATYPANGEMTVVFNDTEGYSYYYENKITFEWVCHTGPAVVPAAGFDASTYLTLPPAGTYERMYSEPAISSWLIPCTGMLDIAASSSSQQSNGVFIFTNSNGTILRTDKYLTTFNGSFSVSGNFNITLHTLNQHYVDDEFAFAWSCGGTRPDLASHDLTSAPETRAPRTVVPRAACEALLSPPLVATIKAPVRAEYVECWTFQCVGTVEVTFRNITTSSNPYARMTLQNSDGYVLTSLVEHRERYIATYPANGEMTVVFNDTEGYSYYYENKITFEWVCHTGPAVVPAAGLDASTYLTLPPVGTYERMFSEPAIYSWLIPCTGMLDIAASSSSQQSNGVFIFTNSNGTILRTDKYSTTFNGSFSVSGNFNITLHTLNQHYVDDEFAFAWSCGGTRPDLASHDLTSAPDTRAPPTVVPRAPCEALLSPPLVATIKAPVRAEYVECWTFQCVGTVEVTFRNITTSSNPYARMTLQNSDGYVLTSLVEHRERYIATYPANGEMMVVFNDTEGYSYYYENKITFEWVCHTGPAVVPAAGFDASTYLTLPPAGTYERMFSEPAISSWLIPCTGMLDIAASSSSQQSNGVFIFTNSNGTILRTDKYLTTFNGSFSVAGNFNITLHTLSQRYVDSEFVFAWSCATYSSLTPLATSAPIATRTPATDAPIAAVTDAPATFAPARVPGSTMVPNTSAPARVPGATVSPATASPARVPGATMVPNTSAPARVPGSTMVPNTAAPARVPGATVSPATASPARVPGSTMVPNTASPARVPGVTIVPDPTHVPSSAPMSPAPDTATPTNLPDGASHVPGTSAPDTALPTATPTDLPAGATFAPSAPAVKALCTADKDCRSGRLDPKATCNAGTCVCHTQGYVHPTGVPLCLLADDVTVPMAFAVEYYGVEAGSLWTTATTRESFEETMSEALGIVTDMRVVVSDGGVLVVGMVRASTSKLADALSGKVDLSAALSSDGVSVSHGVTCARTDASYTVQHNGVCDAVECEGNTTLTLTDGTHTCEREAAPLQPEESGGSSNVVLYVGIGVGVLVVAVCVVAAFCCLQKKQRVKELDDGVTVLENPLFEMSLDDAELYPTGVEEVQADPAEELTLL